MPLGGSSLEQVHRYLTDKTVRSQYRPTGLLLLCSVNLAEMSCLSNWEQGPRKGCTGRQAKALSVSYVLYYFYPHAASILVLDWELTGLGKNHRNPLAQVLWLRSLIALSKGFQARVRWPCSPGLHFDHGQCGSGLIHTSVIQEGLSLY